MAKKKATNRDKKSKTLKKAKTLEATKPLATLNYSTIQWSYTKQNAEPPPPPPAK